MAYSCKTCATCKISQSLTEFAPFKRSKDGRYSYCRACVRIRNKAFYFANKERERERSRADKIKNKERVSRSMAKWRTENKDLEREYRKTNVAIILKRGEKWRKENPDRARAIYSRRRAQQLLSIPAWTDHDKIRAIYAAAHKLSVETGLPHEVDHVVPLRGCVGRTHVVCGLHVETNLQVIPRAENRAKANQRWPHMLADMRT